MEDKRSAFNYMMISAAKTGIFFILFALALFYLIDYNEFSQKSAFPNVKYIIFAIGLFFALKKVNSLFFENNLKFWGILGWGIVFGLLFSLFDGFYYALFFQFLSPETKTMFIEQAKNLYEQFPMDPVQIQMSMELLDKGFIFFMIFGNLISNFFVSIIYSMIFSIFLINVKK